MRLELTRVGLLVELANHYTTRTEIAYSISYDDYRYAKCGIEM